MKVYITINQYITQLIVVEHLTILTTNRCKDNNKCLKMGHFVGFILIPIPEYKSLLRTSFETASAIFQCGFDTPSMI